jgi:hypothetical protein
LLQQQAGKLGTAGPRFPAALLDAIVRDNLCDAVIDQDDAGKWKPGGIDRVHDRAAEMPVAGVFIKRRREALGKR